LEENTRKHHCNTEKLQGIAKGFMEHQPVFMEYQEAIMKYKKLDGIQRSYYGQSRKTVFMEYQEALMYHGPL